jgi:hypothetical protein
LITYYNSALCRIALILKTYIAGLLIFEHTILSNLAITLFILPLQHVLPRDR